MDFIGLLISDKRVLQVDPTVALGHWAKSQADRIALCLQEVHWQEDTLKNASRCGEIRPPGTLLVGS